MLAIQEATKFDDSKKIATQNLTASCQNIELGTREFIKEGPLGLIDSSRGLLSSQIIVIKD